MNSGANGIEIEGSGNMVAIENNTITNVNNNAVVVNDYSNFTFRGNSLKNVGIIPGRGKSGDGQYFGLQYAASNTNGISVIENCVMDNLGYVGIDFRSNNITVQKNIVSNYGIVKDDGGGIYTYNGGSSAYTYVNQKVISNIVYNAIGAVEGVYNGFSGACGIYIDDCSTKVEVKDNTMFNCSGSGLLFHGVNNVTATGNTMFNNGTKLGGNQLAIVMSNCGLSSNNTLQNNIFFSKQYHQEIANMAHQTTDLSNYGSFDNNFYCNPFDEFAGVNTLFSNNKTAYSLDCWMSSYGKDANSMKAPRTYKSYTINSLQGANLYNNGTFDANINGLYCWAPSSNCGASWDNTGKLDGGSLKLTPGTTSSSYGVIGIGAVTASKNYVLKFSMLGSTSCKSVNVFLRQSLSDYINLTPIFSRPIKTSRIENEIVFTAPTTESDASIVFSVTSDAGTIWLDNVNLSPADITYANPDDSVLFFYNDTNSNKTVTLPAGKQYVDVKQVTYSGSVTLTPFTSIVLSYNENLDNSFGDLIHSVTAPTSVTPDSNATVTVNYSASTNRDVIVIFQLDNGAYTPYATAKVDVTAGTNQTVTLTVPINASTPIANDNYQFQVIITPDGGDYFNNLSSKAQVDVDAVSSFSLTNNAVYRLKSNAANVYLNATGNKKGSKVGVATLNTAWDSEKWKIENVSGNVYRLKSGYGTNKYLNSQSNTNGANVNVADYNAGWDSQKWTLEQVSGSTYRLINSWGAKYLNAQGTANGSNVGVADNTGSNSQQWVLELVTSSKVAEDISEAGADRSFDVLDVYPNPLNTGNLNVDVKNLVSRKPVLMTISSILGTTVYSQEVSNNSQYSISRGLFPAKGLYLIKIQDGDFVKTVKVIID